MFFLLRVAFWLTIVLALLPSGGGTQQTAEAKAKVDATEAMVAAGAAVSDMSGFCDRQPTACEVGAQAAVVIGQRAQAGAKMVYDYISDHTSHVDGGSDKAKAKPSTAPKVAAARSVPASPGSQSTLKESDVEPAWQGPMPARGENVPLPRKAPHRKA